MFFITRFSGKMPKWQSQTVKKEFNAFLFPNFSRIRTNRETGNFASVMEKQAFFFLTTMFSRHLVPNSAWEGRSSAVPFFCHYFGFELINAC